MKKRLIEATGLVTAPQYRFRGQQAPTQRAALRAELVAPKTDQAGAVAMIRLYDVIDSWGGWWGISAREFADVLDGLPSEVQTIDLRINSPGGEASEGVAILNLLRAHAANVVATVEGLAASAASFIATGADETVMAPNSQMMIHDAWGVCVGNADDMTQLGGILDKLSNNLAAIYADKAGGTVDDWRTAMRAESWYNADEAVQAGLADNILEQQPADGAQNSFDLSVFTHQGRNKAPVPTFPAKNEPPLSEAGYQMSPKAALIELDLLELEADPALT